MLDDQVVDTPAGHDGRRIRRVLRVTRRVIPGLSRDPFALRFQKRSTRVSSISATSRLWIPGQARDDGGAHDHGRASFSGDPDHPRPALVKQPRPTSSFAVFSGKRGSAGPPSGELSIAGRPALHARRFRGLARTTPGTRGFSQGDAPKSSALGRGSRRRPLSRSENHRRHETPPASPAPRLSAGRSHHRRIEAVPLRERATAAGPHQPSRGGDIRSSPPQAPPPPRMAGRSGHAFPTGRSDHK
jgi:hypothetical protein